MSDLSSKVVLESSSIPPTVPTQKLSKSILETLPIEVAMEILSSFDNFGELLALLSSSAALYRTFKLRPCSILTRVMQKVLGDAWKSATTVLIYQRRGNIVAGNLPDYAAHSYRVEKGDLHNLAMNQKFFKSCSKVFAAEVLERSLAAPITLRGEAENEDETEATSPPPTPFTVNGILPMKYFYDMWLYNYQFGTDSIPTFARRKPLSNQQMSDLNLLSCAMSRLDFEEFQTFIPEPIWGGRPDGCDLFGYGENLFEVCGEMDSWDGDAKKNSLLYRKMRCQLLAAIIHGIGARSEGSLNEFKGDYQKLSVTQLIDKYDLSCGWDPGHPSYQCGLK